MDGIGITTLVLAIIVCGFMLYAMLNSWKIGKCSAYWIITLIGATIILVINIRDIGKILATLISDSSINPLKILVFFLSMTIISIVLDKINFFKFIANKSAKLAKRSQWKLFFIFYVIVSVLTIFTSNDIVILSFVPFICYFCKNHKINPTPYVFSTFVAANTWSMLFIIGNPTNVYVGTFAELTFIEYFVSMLIPTVVCGVVSLLLLVLLFRKMLNTPIKREEVESVEIDKPLVIINVLLLLACIIMLAISSYVNLEMWYIALAFVVIQLIINVIYQLIRKKEKKYLVHSIMSAPWAFVPFLISMFLIISCLNQNGITAILANVFGNDSIFGYGIGSFLFCNIINNIPMTTLFASVLSNVTYSMSAVYATIIGSNLGALLSPVGALAGIMFLNILKEKNVDFKVKTFIKYGVIISTISILITLGTLALIG